MGIEFKDNVSQFSNNCPVRGHLPITDGLVLALRPISAGSLIDLSPNERNVYLKPGGEIFPTGTRRGIVTDLTKDKLSTSFTAIIVAKVYQPADTNTRASLLSNRNSVAPANGITALFISDTAAATSRKATRIRFYKVNSGTNFVVDIDFPVPLDSTDTESPWMYYTVTYDAGTTRISAEIKNMGLKQFYSTTVTGLDFSTAVPMEVGYASQSPVATNSDTQIAQCLIYNRALSDAELTEQYTRDQFWLSAVPGITV